MIQIVNTLTFKAEVGGPMACMYLLGHPTITQVMNSACFLEGFVHEATNHGSNLS